MTQVELVYLLDYLSEEFSAYPTIRVGIAPVTRGAGVFVRSEAREYFFPENWIKTRKFDEVQALVLRIKEVFPDSPGRE